MHNEINFEEKLRLDDYMAKKVYTHNIHHIKIILFLAIIIIITGTFFGGESIVALLFGLNMVALN